MKSKKFGLLVDGALATAVLAAAISATTWARPVVPAPVNCCSSANCAGGTILTVCIEDGCSAGKNCHRESTDGTRCSAAVECW